MSTSPRQDSFSPERLAQDRLAEDLLAEVNARPATLGDARLLCIDGPSGSGKTTLSEALGALAPDARIVHLDDLYAGWRGLPLVPGQLEPLLRPLSLGEPGSFRRYDWVGDRQTDIVVSVAPAELVILEGVGAGSLEHADLITLLVWLDGPPEWRKARALGRDGDGFAPHWDQWAADEAVHFAKQRARERADVVIERGAPG